MEAKVTDARRVALQVLTLVHDGELVDRALSRAGEGLDTRDHAWVQELVYGTTRLRGRLDHVLAAFVRGGVEQLEPTVLDILRLGSYQLLEMGGVPAYAAVSQSVELSRDAGVARAAGLVNGVLQSLRRGANEIRFPTFESSPIEHLASWGSHPRWLVERWLDRWGPEETRRLVEANNRRPELFVTPVGTSVQDGLARLRGKDIDAAEVVNFPGSIQILPPAGPREALAALNAVVQDPAAAMVVRYANVPAGAVVIDLSAAPGGKTVVLAGEGRFVVASDLSFRRLRRTRTNVERTGVSDSVALVAAEGRNPPFLPVDAVLLDAPCSGTGTFRRHADGRWRITPADLATLSRLQAELLDAAASLVRPGGILVYATCSLEPEENELQVEDFLRRRPEFHLAAPGTGIDGTMLTDGFLTVLPQRHGVDGAFAARLERAD